jgi:hypothetical protein
MSSSSWPKTLPALPCLGGRLSATTLLAAFAAMEDFAWAMKRLAASDIASHEAAMSMIHAFFEWFDSFVEALAAFDATFVGADADTTLLESLDIAEDEFLGSIDDLGYDSSKNAQLFFERVRLMRSSS